MKTRASPRIALTRATKNTMTNMINDTNRSEIRAWRRRWIEGNLDRDFEGMAALYTDDAMTMPPNAPSVRGKDENIAFWRAATNQRSRRCASSTSELPPDRDQSCQRSPPQSPPEAPPTLKID